MIIGGVEGLSLLDYPGCLSAIVFTQGCNFRCPFCYNPLLVWPDNGGKTKKIQRDHPRWSEDDLFAFLATRVGKLEAVVVTGGEPTIHRDLPAFIAKIKAMGFLVKLDTNGSNPAVLQALLDAGQLDYVAMDLKASPAKYEQLSGVPGQWSKVAKSITILKQAAVPHEFRTTIVKELLSPQDLLAMAEALAGADLWYWQGFVASQDLVDPALSDGRRYSAAELAPWLQQASRLTGGRVELRGY